MIRFARLWSKSYVGAYRMPRSWIWLRMPSTLILSGPKYSSAGASLSFGASVWRADGASDGAADGLGLVAACTSGFAAGAPAAIAEEAPARTKRNPRTRLTVSFLFAMQVVGVNEFVARRKTPVVSSPSSLPYYRPRGAQIERRSAQQKRNARPVDARFAYGAESRREEWATASRSADERPDDDSQAETQTDQRQHNQAAAR